MESLARVLIPVTRALPSTLSAVEARLALLPVYLRDVVRQQVAFTLGAHTPDHPVASLVVRLTNGRALSGLPGGLAVFKCVVLASLRVRGAGRVLNVAGRGLLQSVVDSEVVQLGQVLVHPQNLLVLDGLLHLGLRRIALLLLLDVLLNFASVDSRGLEPLVLDLAVLDHPSHFLLDVAIGEVLLIQ